MKTITIKNQEKSFDLPTYLFWDIIIEKLEAEKNKKYIITRVFERGSDEHIVQILDFYGIEQVKQVLLEAAYLRDDTITLCCELFSIKPQDFRCYERKQLNKELWTF